METMEAGGRLLWSPSRQPRTQFAVKFLESDCGLRIQFFLKALLGSLCQMSMNKVRWENPDIRAVLFYFLHRGWFYFQALVANMSTVLYFAVVFLNKGE